MIETIGTAGGTSFLISIAFLLGWNQRFGKIEEAVKEMTLSLKSKVDVDMCGILHRHQQEVNIDRKQDVTEIKEKLDEIRITVNDIRRSVNGGHK